MLLRPTKSLALYMQQVGRGLRTYEGKKKAIILDMAGNCFRFGLPTDDRAWELTEDKLKAAQINKEETVIQCKNCFAVYLKSKKECPECGQEKQEIPRKINHVEGELTEIHKLQKKYRQEEYGYKTLEDWKEIARQRGYKMGWAWHRWKARQR